MMNYRCLSAYLLILSAALTIASCASQGVRGQSPFVQINGLKIQDQSLSLDLGVRNVNSEAINIEHIEFSISLDETSLAIYKAASQANIIANGTENLRFELVPSIEGLELLNKLQDGEYPNLEYSLEGMFLVNENKKMKVRSTGHIYPVPGRPGHFR